MIDQIDDVFPVLDSPENNCQGSLVELSGLHILDSEKLKNIYSFPMDDFGDDTSTMASSNMCSQTFETPVRSQRKRSYSDEMIIGFENVYDRIENFLDKEGLHVVSPSPILKCKTLKPCLKMSEITNLTQSAKLQSTNNKAKVSMPVCPALKTALPTFMVKRTASSGSVNNIKSLLLSETKVGFNQRFSLCSKVCQPDSPLNLQENTPQKSN
jgi:hypothetical protein